MPYARRVDEPLSAAEVAALLLAGSGVRGDEVEPKYGIPLDTHKSRLKRARRKLGARNTAHAYALAWRAGYLSRPYD
jgi:DNA-binding CsgD family transcriptional regulator